MHRSRAVVPRANGNTIDAPATQISFAVVVEPFRRCLELAWQSCVEGNIGVGAVITNPTGTIISEGRNRVATFASGEEPIEASPLAHAEINALAKLGGRAGGWPDHTLWTSLEPCVQCAGAVFLARIGEVRFLASDPYWDGAHRLAEILPAHHAELERMRHGPGSGREAVFAALLPLHFAAFWLPESFHWQWYSTHHPTWAALVRDVRDAGELVSLAVARASLDDALAALDARLTALS